jgi:hypothetical protein
MRIGLWQKECRENLVESTHLQLLEKPSLPEIEQVKSSER